MEAFTKKNIEKFVDRWSTASSNIEDIYYTVHVSGYCVHLDITTYCTINT